MRHGEGTFYDAVADKERTSLWENDVELDPPSDAGGPKTAWNLMRKSQPPTQVPKLGDRAALKNRRRGLARIDGQSESASWLGSQKAAKQVYRTLDDTENPNKISEDYYLKESVKNRKKADCYEVEGTYEGKVQVIVKNDSLITAKIPDRPVAKGEINGHKGFLDFKDDKKYQFEYDPKEKVIYFGSRQSGNKWKKIKDAPKRAEHACKNDDAGKEGKRKPKGAQGQGKRIMMDSSQGMFDKPGSRARNKGD